MIRYLSLGIYWLLLAAMGQGQTIGKYEFSPVVSQPFTSYKKQGKTGTCWCFSTISFWESELLRKEKGEFDLAEMFVVRHTYDEKAANYILRQGNARFTQGGLAHDAVNMIAKYGILPQEQYDQFGVADGKYDHTALYDELKAYLDTVIATQNRNLAVNWRVGVDSLLDKFFGKLPVKFTYKGASYTPETFAGMLGIDPADYITITSFTHHPYYEPFILEVPDNWSNGMLFNVPLDELIEVVNHALAEGYTVEWDADTHNNNFSSTLGLAVVPEQNTRGLNPEEATAFLSSKIHPERKIDAVYRQALFEDYTITDDHLMHITGTVKDQKGETFYQVKNSSGDGVRPLVGYLYASESYLRLHTISVMVHRDALPASLKDKLRQHRKASFFRSSSMILLSAGNKAMVINTAAK